MKCRTRSAWLILLLVCVACRHAEGVTVRGEEAGIKTVGAMQGGAWNLWSNGEWGEFIAFGTAGRYMVRVECFGTPAGGEWPVMGFSVDGEVVDRVTVAGRERRVYGFEVEAKARVYRIALAFLNDAVIAGEDRNLYLVEISVRPVGEGEDPTVEPGEAWRAAYAERKSKAEVQTVAAAEVAIERDRKRDVRVRVADEEGRPIAEAQVAVELVRHDFLFGCNILKFDHIEDAERNEAYKRRFDELFNAATIGFYWRWYEWEQGRPHYEYTDKVAAWCEERGIRMKGHPLLWDHEAGRPRWAEDRQPAEEVQRRRVEEIIERYKGRITYWEVVNEPSHCKGVEIDGPYRWARQADPQACLILNDYYVFGDGCPGFYGLLEGAIERGVPFDGIGIQAHEPRWERFELDKVKRILDEYAALGKEIFITEFSPTSAGERITGSHVEGVWDEAAQADYAAKFYTVCFGHPAVQGITWWDFCDEGSWIAGAGMLREDMSPKPVYAALRELIRGTWRTRATGRTDAEGMMAFRGFCGEYMARVEQEGRVTERMFHVGRGEDGVIEIVVDGEGFFDTDSTDYH